MNILSLCSGIGGLDRGVHLAIPSARTVCYVELDPFCQEILLRRADDGWLDRAPLWPDLRTFDGRPWRGLVDCDSTLIGLAPRGVPGLHFLCGDFAAKGLPDGPFDAVLCLDVIEHMDDRPALLAEIRRILKPGGLLFISAPNRETSWRRRLRAAGLPSFSDPDHRIEYTRQEFVGELYAAGFALADAIRPTTLDTPWAGLQDALGACWLPLYAWLHRRRREAVGQETAESTGFRAVAAKVDKR